MEMIIDRKFDNLKKAIDKKFQKIVDFFNIFSNVPKRIQEQFSDLFHPTKFRLTT